MSRRLVSVFFILALSSSLLLVVGCKEDGGGSGLADRFNKANVEQNTLKQCLLCGDACVMGAEEIESGGEQARELVNVCLQERCLRVLRQDLEARKAAATEIERMLTSCRMKTLAAQGGQ